MKNPLMKRRIFFVIILLATALFAKINIASAAAPAAPTLNYPTNYAAYPTLSSSTVNGTLVSFNWDSVDGEGVYYLLQLSPDSLFQTLLVNKYEDTWTSDIYSPLPDNGTVYYWRVFACNADGCGESQTYSFKNGPSAPPAMPYLSSPNDNIRIDGPTATFDWTNSARAAGYYLYIAYDTNFDNIRISQWDSGSSTTVSSMPDNGLAYYWRACAYNSKGETCSSSYRTITSGPSAAPATPTLYYPDNGVEINDIEFALIWNSAARAADYYLQVATDSQFTGSNIVYGNWLGGDNIYYFLGGLLDNDKPYYWRVKAKNSLGESTYSTYRSFTYYDNLTCTSVYGSGIGVMNNIQSHIDTCYASDGSYYLYDISRRAGQTGHHHTGAMKVTEAIKTKDFAGYIYDDDNEWVDDPVYDYAPSVDAHAYAAKVYDYLYNTFQMKSYDGDNGSSMVSTVNIPSTAEAACQDINAFWYDGRVNYCESVNGYKPYSGALDVVAHEWGHAITEKVCGGLDYRWESGALNEAFSDWMGTAVEHFYGENNWTIGEGISTDRDLSDPLLHTSYCVTGGVGYNQPQPDHMSGYIACSNDNGGVHLNSGIPNKMFYLLSEGGTHNSVTVQGLGIEKAMKVAFIANKDFWAANSTFQDALKGMIDTAKRDFLQEPNVLYQVQNAWAAVGVGTLPTISTYTNLSGSGATTGDGSYEWGKDVTVTATAAPGYYFVNWVENGTEVSALATYNFTINGSRSLVANFAVTPSTGNISYTSGSFINTYVGEQSPPTTFTVKNSGLSSFTVSDISITGNNPQDFTISNTESQDYCGGKTLTTFTTCTVQAKFSPQSAGSKAATLNIQTDASVNSLLTAPLSGTGETPPTYIITATAGSGGSISPSGTVTVTQGQSKAFDVSPLSGYHILSVTGCGGTLSDNTYTTGAIAADCTITASFAINTYVISTTAGSGGTITPSSPTVNYGGSQTFNISADPCYTLTDVKVDGVSQGAITSYTFTDVTANHTIEASFSIKSFRIRTEVINYGGTISPYDGIYGVAVNCGSTPTFTITPYPGYHIKNVKVNGVLKGAIDSYTFPPVTTNQTIWAYFEISIYTLTISKNGIGSGTVTSSPTGISCGTTCSGTFGGSVTLTASADANSTFTGWSGGGCSGTGDCTVTMTADTNVTATFGCSASPIRILGKADYSTLQAAYNAAVDGDMILSRGITLTENLSADMNKSVTIEGGYICDYSSSPGVTSLSGSMTINSGTVNIKNFSLEY